METERMSTRPRDEQPLAGFGPTRVFRAASMREAFVMVKTTIGPEAVILTTRDFGQSGSSDDQRFEVVAAWPSATTAAPSSPGFEPRAPRAQRDVTMPDALRMGDSARPDNRAAPRDAGRDAGRDDARLTSQLRQLEQAVRGLESQIQLLAEKDRRMRDELGRLGQAKALLEEGGPTATLMAAGLERDVASELVERAVRRATPRQGVAVARHPDLADEILRTVKVSPPLWSLPGGSIAALIGPSAAGKTTTLLKLAGLATFAHRRTVAIISTDFERLGAFDSLAMYAEVMGVPAVAARDRADVDEALERFTDKDLILMDTAGHNPFDPNQRFAALKPVSGREVRHHLVLPATLSPGLVADMLTAYDGPALESLIVTRLDEARGPSAVLAACLRAELPVSHLASGREIPDDIRAVDPHEVARGLLERAS